MVPPQLGVEQACASRNCCSSPGPARKQPPIPPSGNITHSEADVTYTKSPLPDVIHDYDNGDDKGYTVRYFEQDEHGVVRQLRSQDEFSKSWAGQNDPLAQKAKQMVSQFSDADVRMPTKTEVDTLAEEITGISNSGAPPETIISRLGRFVRGLSSPRVPQIARDSELKEILQAADNEVVTQIPTIFWKGNPRAIAAIEQLNQALRRFDKPLRRKEVPQENTFVTGWRRYLAARGFMALHYDKIHRDVWDMLWKMFSIEHENNPLRLTQISKLARDMSLARVELKPEQQLATIESIFADGEHSQALENWRRSVSTLGGEAAETFVQFWELGVRMQCQLGDLDKAQQYIRKLLDRQSDPRILIDFIHAALTKDSSDGRDQAVSAYHKLRNLLGDDMGLIDFDRVISFFLVSNDISTALDIFVDMMTKGALSIPKNGGKIPSIISNKFFFGKWLKRLIGNGELESALKVVRFMQQHNIPGAAVQLNGLIGGWQRSGSAADLANADALAWEMVRARLDFVSKRNGSSKEFITEEDREHGAPLPMATLETFSLLAEDYHLRRLDGKLMKLWDAFDQAEIPYNAFMLNQIMANSLAFNRVDEALTIYNTLVNKKNMKPNAHTFMELWKALEVNRVMQLAPTQFASQIEAARKTFGEISRHADVFNGAEIHQQLARKILHTFRRLNDRPGFVIALSMMRRFFGFLPSESLALELVIGSTNLMFESPHARQKVRAAKARMEAELFEIRRRNAGNEQARLSEEIPEVERKELLFSYLRDHFLHGEQHKRMEPVTEEVLNKVAADMGLFELRRQFEGRE